jgi:predicted nuclease of restriction endonuclease-like (RecB) superfamily
MSAIQFADVFPNREIVVSLIRQLTWTHFVALIPLKNALQRDFYAEMCRVEHWSVRTPRSRIDSMLFERTALSKKPNQLIEKELKALRGEDRLTPDLVFRDEQRLHDAVIQTRLRITDKQVRDEAPIKSTRAGRKKSAP